MKRNLKKVMAIVLSAALAMAMCVTAFAAETATIKMASNANGNTYSVYKIFDAKAVGTDNNNKTTYQYTFPTDSPFKNFFGTEKDYNLNDQGQIIENKTGGVVFGNPDVNNGAESDARWTNTNKTKTAALAAALANYARANNITSDEELKDTNEKTFSLGYYLIVETESGKTVDTNAASEVASKPMLVDLTKGNAEISPKNDWVDLDKVIVDDKDEVESNSAKIGDDINYKVTTTLPVFEANINKKKISFVLTDTFSKGLTFNDDIEIENFVKGTDYTVSEAVRNADGTTTVTVTFTQDAIYNNQGKSVVMTYSAKLNGDAVVNSTTGNPNKIKLNYSNNPGQVSDKDGEEGKIPTKELEDEVITYTYGIDIIKVDGQDNSKLPGAEFELTDSTGKKVEFVKITDASGNDIYRVATKEEIADENVTTTTTVTSKNGNTKAVIEGLDAGTYNLTETKAPDEYTKLANSIEVKIEEVTGDTTKKVIEKTYDEDGNLTKTEEKTETVTGPTGEAKITVTGTAVIDEQGNTTGKIEADKNGNIEMKVIVPNVKGVSMPETGARTAMYCMIGGAAIVILGAGYYLIGARRNKKEQ